MSLYFRHGSSRPEYWDDPYRRFRSVLVDLWPSIWKRVTELPRYEMVSFVLCASGSEGTSVWRSTSLSLPRGMDLYNSSTVFLKRKRNNEKR
jgi:hypothetical protein